MYDPTVGLFWRVGTAVAELETVEEDDETTWTCVLRELKLDELELPDDAKEDEEILELELVRTEVDAVELFELEADEDIVELMLEDLELEIDVDFVELVERVVEVTEDETVDALVELDVFTDETEDDLVLVDRAELFDEVVETIVEIREDELVDVDVTTTGVLDDTTELVDETRLFVLHGGRVTVLLKS